MAEEGRGTRTLRHPADHPSIKGGVMGIFSPRLRNGLLAKGAPPSGSVQVEGGHGGQQLLLAIPAKQAV